MRISHSLKRRVDDDVIRALILVTLFESSDRARIQIYNPLDALKGATNQPTSPAARRSRTPLPAIRATDQTSMNKRLDQPDQALPWVKSQRQADRGPAI